jgi:hypothetical protein
MKLIEGFRRSRPSTVLRTGESGNPVSGGESRWAPAFAGATSGIRELLGSNDA